MKNALFIREGIEEMYEVDDDLVIVEPLTALDEAVMRLRQAGVEVPTEWWEPSLLPLVAEAINWAAKTVDPAFYDLKGEVVDEIAQSRGIQSGWGEDGVFYLYSPEVGVVCFHDPWEEITSEGEWSHPWSGIERQSLAFDALRDPELRQELAKATAPA